jgi:hypothetical protein
MPFTILPGIIQLARSPFLGHLHGAQDRQVDMPAADHRERIGAGEIAGRRQLRDGLLAGVDEVGILLALERERAHAEHAVLALQLHPHAPAG